MIVKQRGVLVILCCLRESKNEFQKLLIEAARIGLSVYWKMGEEKEFYIVNRSQDKFGQVGTDIASLPNDELNYWGRLYESRIALSNG